VLIASYAKERGGIPLSRGWLAFMWAVIGGVVGQLLGSALAGQLPFLNTSIRPKLGPVELDLAFLHFSFGLELNLSIGGAIGLVLALWLALRKS